MLPILLLLFHDSKITPRDAALPAFVTAAAILLALVLCWAFNTPCGPTPAPVLPDDAPSRPAPVSILES